MVSDRPAARPLGACLREALPESQALARLRPRVVAVSCPVFPGLAPAPAVARPALLARFSAAAVLPVQQLAESGASAQPGLALRLEEPAGPDAAWVAEVVPLRAAEPPGAAAGLQQEVRDGEAEQQPGARDAEAPQPEVPGGPAVELPSAAAWVFRPDPILPWPEP